MDEDILTIEIEITKQGTMSIPKIIQIAIQEVKDE